MMLRLLLRALFRRPLAIAPPGSVVTLGAVARRPRRAAAEAGRRHKGGR